MAKLKTGRHTSGLKAARQAYRRALKNRGVRRNIRLLAKQFTEAAAKKDQAALPKLMAEVSSAWDKAAKSGVVHWKAAARKKSRLAKAAQRPAAVAAAPSK